MFVIFLLLIQLLRLSIIIQSNRLTWDLGIVSNALSHARVKVMVVCCTL